MLLGAAYWGKRAKTDLAAWPNDPETRRSQICDDYEAIARAAATWPDDAVVLIEPATDETEHFSIYYLYPRRVVTAPGPDVTHSLRLGTVREGRHRKEGGE